MKKKICAAIAISCVFMLIGTAGASDKDFISPLRALAQGTLSLAGLIISLKMGGFFE
jgi:hypothetical protein